MYYTTTLKIVQHNGENKERLFLPVMLHYSNIMRYVYERDSITF